MKFLSTKNQQLRVALKEAVLSGMAPQCGLYMPETIPELPHKILETLHSLSFQEIALAISRNFLADAVQSGDLEQLVQKSMDLDVRITELTDSISVLETYHGPTMAFKDFGARFMAQLMGYLMRGETRELTILVATSGDTGSAVASGFLGVPGIRVVILYPSGKVSPSQEQQLTTQGQNIQALEISGTFDDCQNLVKTAFADAELRQRHLLSSANSINIARLLPQSFYYAFAAGRLQQKGSEVTISVPCGNFGNLTAGLLAQRMGVPIAHFVAATNANDIFPSFLSSGTFQPRPSIQTLSNAMDVGNPSNLDRIRYLFDDDLSRLRKALSSWSFDDQQTREMILQVHETFGYVIDPHTAVGFLGLETYQHLVGKEVNGLVVSTAHPAKFPESVEPMIGQKIPIPEQLAQYLHREKQARAMSNDYEAFRQYLMDTLS